MTLVFVDLLQWRQSLPLTFLVMCYRDTYIIVMILVTVAVDQTCLTIVLVDASIVLVETTLVTPEQTVEAEGVTIDVTVADT